MLASVDSGMINQASQLSEKADSNTESDSIVSPLVFQWPDQTAKHLEQCTLEQLQEAVSVLEGYLKQYQRRKQASFCSSKDAELSHPKDAIDVFNHK